MEIGNLNEQIFTEQSVITIQKKIANNRMSKTKPPYMISACYINVNGTIKFHIVGGHATDWTSCVSMLWVRQAFLVPYDRLGTNNLSVAHLIVCGHDFIGKLHRPGSCCLNGK